MPKISKLKITLSAVAFLYAITWIIVVPKTHEKLLNNFFEGINSSISKPQGYFLLLPEVNFETKIARKNASHSSTGEMQYYATAFTILPFIVHYTLITQSERTYYKETGISILWFNGIKHISLGIEVS